MAPRRARKPAFRSQANYNMANVPTTRPDLTDYRPYIDVLLEKLNENSVYKMSIEDLVKLLIEKAMKEYCPDVVIVPKRKRYETWKF